MGPGAAHLLFMAIFISAILFSFIGMIFYLVLKGTARLTSAVVPISGLLSTTIKRASLVGIIFGLCSSVAIFMDTKYHTNINQPIFRVGPILLLFAFFPLAMRCIDQKHDMHKWKKILIAMIFTTIPMVLFAAIHFLIVKR